MVTMDTDVEELLGLVSNCGRDIDDAVSQLENLSEVVKKGMQQVEDEQLEDNGTAHLDHIKIKFLKYKIKHRT